MKEKHRRARPYKTMRNCALSGIVLAAALAGGCEQRDTLPAGANQGSAPAAVTHGPVIDENVGSNWASSRPPGSSDHSRSGLSQTVRMSSGLPMEISLACAINVYAREQSHQRLDGTESEMLSMLVPQGGLLISMNMASIADNTALVDDVAYANQQTDLLQKKFPGSIIDTNGPVYQQVAMRNGKNIVAIDASFDGNILHIPIVGPPMKGKFGDVVTQPYVALKDFITKKNLAIVVPAKGGGQYYFSMSDRDTIFWKYVESCYRSY